MKPMLAQSAGQADLVRLCNDPEYAETQKVDGVRIMIVTGNGRVQALNRKGEPTHQDLPSAVRDQFAGLKHTPCTFDGEYVADCKTYFVFDMPSVEPYIARRDALEFFVRRWTPAPCVKLLPVARTAEAKVELAVRLLENGAEGVMFNRLQASYEFGRRSFSLLKVKFIKDVDCVVTALNLDSKANMQLAVYDGDELRIIGECTALAGDGARVKPGDVVTVQYLYALDPSAPRLYQPTRPRIRTDKSPRECVLDQIRFTNRGVIAA